MHINTLYLNLIRLFDEAFRKFRLSTIVLVSCILNAACTTPTTPDFAGMSAAYANLLEQYQINSNLSNIIRAAGERPLSFLEIPSINGSGNVINSVAVGADANGFVGGIPGGPMGIYKVAPTWGLSFGNSFNFTQSSLDNATFLHGFLSQVPVEYARYFISDNLPKELVFSLLISSIRITNPDGTYRTYVNNPLLPDHGDFQKTLYRLLDQGLSIRQVPGGVAQTQLSYNGQAQARYKLCIDVDKYSDYKQLEFNQSVYCHVNELLLNEKKENKPQLTVMLRSTNNVFEYLGQVVVAQNSENPYMVTIPPTKGTPPRKTGQQNQYALLVVKKNAVIEKAFASIKNLDGDVYSVPAIENGYSPTVLKFISQLLSLNKVPGSIPPSPAVLMR